MRIENQDYKNENIERKQLENMQNNQFLKVKIVFQRQKKMKERNEKQKTKNFKKKIEKLLNKPINVSKDYKKWV